jgi:hypothetical protein
MTLHKAIEKLLLDTGRPMTAIEIADELNKTRWYARRDGAKLRSNQISARTNNYPRLFGKDESQTPQLIYLINKRG